MQAGNVIYEILAVVEERHRSAWELYMRTEHVPEVIAAGGFLGASLLRGEPGRYRVRYVAPDRAQLERYRREVAPALRQAALDRFPDGVALDREEWDVVAGW